ncbi:protein pigeon-like isoform X3 [Actinia tenebrosa]|uniref:Protein pigeon-like isoform X3 n=1 Tax=Actinia tenebrosa TaxID=6105 RepID=A0A6P8IKM5_ACTTE|nr:protein pigeon-like isoform X3 [Actinia tenebrosa]
MAHLKIHPEQNTQEYTNHFSQKFDLKTEYFHCVLKDIHSNEYSFSMASIWAMEIHLKRNHICSFSITKKAIGLYHIPMARIGDKGMIMSSQPRTEQVGGPFYWAQWDTLNQRLYFLHKKFKEDDEEEKGSFEWTFSAYQFSEKVLQFCVLNMQLPFNIDTNHVISSSAQYFNLPLMQTISEKQFNMQVVTTAGGSLYICLQHKIEDEEEEEGFHSEQLPLQKRLSSETPPTEQSFMASLEYSVYFLHHDCILHCVLHCVPKHLVKKSVLFFSSLHNYLLVLLPGYALHLLNGNAEHEPCHHIILQGDEIPKFSVQGPEDQPPLLLYLHKQQNTFVVSEPDILDSRSGDGFELNFCKDRLVEIFSKTHLPTTRLSLLHLVLVHIKDAALLKKMIEHLCYDPSSPECTDLLKEYLMGSTYALMKKVLDRDVHRLVPFTCVDTFRGHLEESLDKRRIARIDCTLCRDTCVEFKNDKKKPLDGFWSAVKENKEYAKQQNLRFSLKSLGMCCDEESDEETETSQQQQLSQPQASSVKTLLRRFSSKKYPSMESVTSQTSTKSGDFLEYCEDDRSISEIKKQNMVIDRLAAHFQAHLPRETRTKTHNIAVEYVKNQAAQSDALLRLFRSGLGFSSDTNPTITLLFVRGTIREIALFQMVERYYTSVTDIKFPFPPGFQTFFTTLACRCLNQRMFMQYVDNNVLQLTDQFISRLVDDWDGESGDSDFVFQILSRLKHEKVKQAIQRWDHPLSTRYLSQQIADELLSTDLLECLGDKESLDCGFSPGKEGGLHGSFKESESFSDEEPCFRPLSTLMSTLREKAAHLPNESQFIDGGPYNLKHIEDVALLQTSREVDGSLATVPF